MNLTRRSTIGLAAAGFAAAGLSTASLPAKAAPRLQYDLQPKPVGDGIWMVEGLTDYFSMENGGAIVNCAIVETDIGLVIVDTGSSLRYGEALRKVVAGLGGLGVAAVINTHHHPDHFFGNQVFADKPIHALGETAEMARQQGDAFADNMYRILGDWMRGTQPVPPNTNIDTSVLTIGGREFQTLPLAGHTASDLALIDRRTGMLISGDLLFLDRAPTTPHANLADWKASLDTIESLGASAILPGHGPLDTSGKSIDQTRSYLTWLEDRLKRAAVDGLSMVEIMRQPIPAEFASMGAMPEEYERSVVHLYPGIERAAMPLAKDRS